MRLPLLRLALLAWLAVVLAVTLSPHNTRTQAQGERVVAQAKRHVDLRDAEVDVHRETDVVGNVLLFVPLGALGLFAFPDRRRAVLWAGISLSAAIELLQLGYLPHRSASVQDVALNSLGHLLGVGAALVVLRIARPGKTLAT